jgi:hypothetical protein
MCTVLAAALPLLLATAPACDEPCTTHDVEGRAHLYVRADVPCPAPTEAAAFLSNVEKYVGSDSEAEARYVCWYRVDPADGLYGPGCTQTRAELAAMANRAVPTTEKPRLAGDDSEANACDDEGDLIGFWRASGACRATVTSGSKQLPLVGRDEYPAVASCAYATHEQTCTGGSSGFGTLPLGLM